MTGKTTLKIGADRQLFVDDHVIEDADGVEARSPHP